MIPGAICTNCVFFSPARVRNNANPRGQCRRHAPLLDFQGDHPQTLWPMVREDQWCGEHATVEEAA